MAFRRHDSRTLIKAETDAAQKLTSQSLQLATIPIRPAILRLFLLELDRSTRRRGVHPCAIGFKEPILRLRMGGLPRPSEDRASDVHLVRMSVGKFVGPFAGRADDLEPISGILAKHASVSRLRDAR